jgi:uncharacterized protein with von Willebrand factor type A (vWA) domain
MFAPLITSLRDLRVPVSLLEYLTLLRAVQAGLATNDVDGFYLLARLTLIKDERHFDAFDRAFSAAFAGAEAISPQAVISALDIPKDWLTKLAEGHLTPEERNKINALGGLEALMATLRLRLAEQSSRHQGGNKWIGTAGTSPFGGYGYNPEGIRMGQEHGRQHRAVKVWDQREYRALAGDTAIGIRSIKLALRALRQWARTGAEEFDLPATIAATAAQGMLDVQMRPTRRNGIKVLLFLDIGGSMDAHIAVLEQMFSAAKAEFRCLNTFYFHNCLYEKLWRDPARRWGESVNTADVLHQYGPDHRAIFIGDAAMSPYEILHPGGAVEYMNAEAGAVWLARACTQWPRHLWINPTPQPAWSYSHSTQLIAQAFSGKMVPSSLDGLARGMKVLK